MLRFRRPPLEETLNAHVPALAADEYDFLWEYGPLGLVVGEARSGLPFVRSFTGKGTSRQLGLVQAEDEIVLVNDRSAELMGFAETMDYIMNVPKPAVLRFRRRQGLGADPVAATLAMAAMRISSEQATQQQQTTPAPVPVAVQAQAQSPVQKASKPELRDLSYPMSPARQSSQSPSHVAVLGDRSSFARSGNRSSLASPSDEVPPQAVAPALVPVPVPAPLPLATNRNSGGSEDYFTVDQSAFYQIQWTDGPFGLTVREAMSKLGAVMLITKRTGKATCAGLKRVAVGDILVRIGDKNVGELGFDAATRFLRTVMKPVVLTFQAID
jgi:hypothetical protein